MVKPTNLTGVSVMTTGPLPPNPAELLAGPRFSALLGTAAEFFDMVIIDGPPIMGLADAPILGSLTDGTMLVVEGAKTRRAVVRDALKRLNFARARVVGGVLNKYHPKHGGASYGYGYGYGKGYGYGADKFVYGQKPKPALNTPQDAS
jgi:polysaccharide biosynthesis transport protein